MFEKLLGSAASSPSGLQGHIIMVTRAFCVAGHEAVGQTRKYTGEPYWHHPFAVATIVRGRPHSLEMEVAAYLHDLLEDTKVTPAAIGTFFGDDVLYLVQCLTHTTKPEDGVRAERMAIERARLADAPSEAKTIKLADLIDNTSTIVARDPGFARIYMPEKRLLLDEALRGGDATLWARADYIVREWERQYGRS